MKIFKIVILGDECVGKSSLLRMFVDKKFVNSYKPTLGVEYTIKDITINEEFIGKFAIVDTAGQESYATLRSVCYQDSSGALLVFDVTNKHSLTNIGKWMDEILKNAGKIPIVLIGNKIDLQDARELTTEQCVKVAEEWNAPFLETSAKTGINVEEAFQKLALIIRKSTLTTEISI
ncbi:MAG: GTP-binding protein [Candidatus Hodarchaeota archaeon]